MCVCVGAISIAVQSPARCQHTNVLQLDRLELSLDILAQDIVIGLVVLVEKVFQVRAV